MEKDEYEKTFFLRSMYKQLTKLLARMPQEKRTINSLRAKIKNELVK